mgnify:FL=1
MPRDAVLRRAGPTVLYDARTRGLAAAGFANFFLHWHAAFRLAWEARLTYAVRPQEFGYEHDRHGFCNQSNCSDYVNIWSLGLLDPASDLILPDGTTSKDALATGHGSLHHLPAQLPQGNLSWTALLRDAMVKHPNATAFAFRCNTCQDGDFSTTANELRRRMRLTAGPPRNRSRVRIAIHLRRGDLLFYHLRRERMLPDAWYIRLTNEILDVCHQTIFTCEVCTTPCQELA